MKYFIGRKLTLAVILLVIAGLACNLPAQNSGSGATPTATTGTDQAGSATQTPAPQATSPSSTVTVTVSTMTNCRTGPGTNYDLVLTFQPGATAEVVGKYSPTNYWIIKTPTGGTCWLWGAYATVQGDTSSLAEIAPPPSGSNQVAENPTNTPNAPKSPKATATATATNSFVIKNPVLINQGNIIKALYPSAPSSLSVSTTCTYNIFPVTLKVRTDHLSWSSVSNATGYYVYENGSKISSTTGTSINLVGATSTGVVSFGVVAYNSFGTSSTTSKGSKCP